MQPLVIQDVAVWFKGCHLETPAEDLNECLHIFHEIPLELFEKELYNLKNHRERVIEASGDYVTKL